MLSETRQEQIASMVENQGSIQASQLVSDFQTSISTIRRDLETLEKQGRLIRVHGGAVRKSQKAPDVEEKTASRRGLHALEKREIAQKASRLIEPDTLVYLDAGTTTEALIEALDPSLAGQVHFVTNAIEHASKLAARGFDVSILGGAFKAVTEAIVGEEALRSLQNFNFDLGFFGTNAVDESGRLSTPDFREAAVKGAAMQACFQPYVLADPSKFFQQSHYNFGRLDRASLITSNSSIQFPNEWKVYGKEIL